MQKSTCSVTDCKSITKGRGLCNLHLIRLRKHGSTDAYHPNATKACAIAGCTSPHHARGWCVKHWNRWKNAGDPNVVRKSGQADRRGSRNPMWRGDEVTYETVHWRMSREDPARNHSCAHCSGPAKQWAYTHDAPNEKQSEVGPYSVDPEFYIPLCISCHVKFDHGRTAAQRVN